MRHLRSLALPAIPALALAACTSVSTLQNDLDDDLARGMKVDTVVSDGVTVKRESGTVAMTESGIEIGDFVLAGTGGGVTIEVDGEVYSIPGSSKHAYTNPQWVNEHQYDGYTFKDVSASGLPVSSASFVVGKHMAVGSVESGTDGKVYLMHGGIETPAGGLPDQSAIYEGAWEIRHNSGAANDIGVFAADANFDAGRIGFSIDDDEGKAVGNGTGTISGTGFNSTFNVTATGATVGTTSENAVEGNFYGPNAEEMAGVSVGQDTLGAGGDTYGVLYGHQR